MEPSAAITALICIQNISTSMCLLYCIE